MKKNSKVLIYNEESKTLRSEKFNLINGNDLETSEGWYPMDNCERLIDETDGSIYYFFNVPKAAKLEAENLKMLRRNVALNNIFNYQTKKQFDIIAFMPWLIIIAMILFM